MSHLLLLSVLSFCSPPATSADLSKIDRTVAKEPKYQSSPKYCLLVFGLDARTKVWLVLDGDVLYVDRNGNGDLTEGKKQVRMSRPQGDAPGYFVCGDIILADGKTVCTGLIVHGSQEEPDMSVDIDLNSNHGQSAGADANGYLEFADTPGQAPIIHFNGPLTMGLTPDKEITQSATFVKKGDRNEIIRSRSVRLIFPKFVRGSENVDLRVAVGTAGLGKGTFARLFHTRLAEGIQPEAEIEFPNTDPAKGAIKINLGLALRC
jgi:hypothetical protein